MRFVRLFLRIVPLYLIGSFTCFLTFRGITFSPTVTTSRCGCSFFHDFLSEMLNASISFQFYSTGFLSCMPYPLDLGLFSTHKKWLVTLSFDLGLFDTHKMISYPVLLTWASLILLSFYRDFYEAILQTPAILLFLFLVFVRPFCAIRYL